MDNVQGLRGSPSKMIPLVWGPLTVPCPWAPEGHATLVDVTYFDVAILVCKMSKMFVQG